MKCNSIPFWFVIRKQNQTKYKVQFYKLNSQDEESLVPISCGDADDAQYDYCRHFQQSNWRFWWYGQKDTRTESHSKTENPRQSQEKSKHSICIHKCTITRLEFI